MIVEDDQAIRNFMTATLDLNAYQCIAAESGEQALMYAVTNRPDIIILDLGLPDMDGVDIIKKLRTWSHCPIIVVSARSEDRDKISALDAGADDYLTKPFSMDELLARLRVAVRQIQHGKLPVRADEKHPAHERDFRNGGHGAARIPWQKDQRHTGRRDSRRFLKKAHSCCGGTNRSNAGAGGQPKSRSAVR